MSDSSVAERTTPPEKADSPFGIWDKQRAGEKRLKVLLYGASGSGKTYFAGTFPKPLFLDLEDGMRTVLALNNDILRFPKEPNTRIVDFQQVREFYKLVKKVNPKNSPFETIVIDSMNELQVLILKYLVENYSDKSRVYDDQPTMADYGKLARDMQTVVRMFLELPYHIVFTAVSAEKEYPDDQSTPTFIGKKTGPDIKRIIDIIGYCHTVMTKDGQIKHVAGFTNCPSYIAKDRTGNLTGLIANNYQAILSKINSTSSKEK